jgi:hypothetical protein
VKYIIRLNQKAFNPVTRALDHKRMWEVEQVAARDSARVIWHCADVRVDTTPVREFFTLSAGEQWSKECFGICIRGADDALEIRTGKADASGN